MYVMSLILVRQLIRNTTLYLYTGLCRVTLYMYTTCIMGGTAGGRYTGEKGAGSLREAGEERAGSGITKVVGNLEK